MYCVHTGWPINNRRTRVIGPYFFPNTVSADSYLEMLNTFAISQARQLVGADGDNVIWWQQDGAAPHYAIRVRERLDMEFPDHLIGRRGPLEWPPRSPDLSPLDFSVWGIVKELVYNVKIMNMEHLRERIVNAFETFDGELCASICGSVRGRIIKCMELNGSYIENHM